MWGDTPHAPLRMGYAPASPAFSISLQDHRGHVLGAGTAGHSRRQPELFGGGASQRASQAHFWYPHFGDLPRRQEV
jgi:hypothetical protein